jgi:hypothetical protein
MASKILFAYSRGTKKEGWRKLCVAILICVVIVAASNLPDFRKQAPVAYILLNTLALIVGLSLGLAYALPNIVMDREFRFVLYEDRMECKFPAKWFGESYSVPIGEIARLERYPDQERDDWALVTCDNRRIKITHNYENPVEDIVKILRTIRPELPISVV